MSLGILSGDQITDVGARPISEHMTKFGREVNQEFGDRLTFEFQFLKLCRVQDSTDIAQNKSSKHLFACGRASVRPISWWYLQVCRDWLCPASRRRHPCGNNLLTFTSVWERQHPADRLEVCALIRLTIFCVSRLAFGATWLGSRASSMTTRASETPTKPS
jgi:hypothetical protein